MAADAETQVLVRFITKLPAELRVPEAEVAVPATLKRYGLSQIINHLLALEPARPFDFLVDGELLRHSLEQHLLSKGISTEAVLEVEYVPAVVPPEAKQAVPHDDWVSAVEACSSSSVASGSYDGLVRLWDEAGACQASFAAHTSGVNALTALPAAQGALLLSAGKDHKLRLWQLPQPPRGSRGAAAERSAGAASSSGGDGCSLVAVYNGHGDAVEGIAASPTGERFASGGWDGALLLWDTGRATVEAAAAEAPTSRRAVAAAKKRRVGEAQATDAVPEGALAVESTGRLEGHLHCVAAVAWPEEETVYSGGWDHSVRRFDVTASINTDTYNGSKAVHAVAVAPGGAAHVVAFAGSDRALRLWDVRARSGEGLAVKAYASHGGWVSELAWSPTSQHHLASASHDGSVKMWDVRCAVPLATLKQHSDKALCVAWWGGDRLVSGGADCAMRVYESPAQALEAEA